MCREGRGPYFAVYSVHGCCFSSPIILSSLKISNNVC